MIHQENCEPRISDYNENGLLNLEGILDICENAASHHSAKASFDVIAKRMDGITWVLAEWNVCILHRPKSGERLHISTWVREENVTTTTNRDLVVKNDAGDDCILAKAKFVLFDMQTRRPTRISPEVLAAFQPENATSMDFDTAHLQEPSCYEREITLALRRTDADFNGHIHTARYISLALESLPDDLYKSDNFTGFRIVYRQPLVAGDIVTLRCHTESKSEGESESKSEGYTSVIGFYRQDGTRGTHGTRGTLATLVELKG